MNKSVIQFRIHRFGVLVLLLFACSNKVNFDVPPASDSFAQTVTYNNKVDILFIIDNSDSMKNARQNLYDSMPYLTKNLNELKMDYHIASTTTTMIGSSAGRLFGEPKFLTQDTPQFEQRLREKILVDDNGSVVERGLDAVLKVTNASYNTTEGQNFLRPEALFVMIYVTNEDDKSINLDHSHNGAVTKFYQKYFDQMKPPMSNGQRSWIFNFVGITSLNDTCKTGSVFVDPGYNLMELARYTSGRIESICSPTLGAAVLNIKARIVQVLTDYPLSKKPLVDTIRVSVNGQPVQEDPVNGWSYIAELNVVRFNGKSVPAADAQVQVDFKPEGSN